MRWLIMLAGLMLPLAAHAAPMCAPHENPIICAMIEQRDNAMDDAARAEGGRREEIAKNEAVAAYWRSYTAHLVNQAQIAKRLAPVCAWRGAENAPTARLCSWWRPRR